jgi:two-component system sensor histidine kinase AlgZ
MTEEQATISAAAPTAWLSRIGRHVLVWVGIAGAHATITLAAAARRGVSVAAWPLILNYVAGYLPWALLSVVLAWRFVRRPALLTSAGSISVLFVTLVAAFFLPQLAYQVALTTVLSGQPLSEVPARLREMPMTAVVLDAMLFVATCAVMAAAAGGRERRIAAQRQQQLHRENEALRLETARQRLRVLQTQLEPHFLFNALNAIGATVRTGDQRRALRALQELASLLRFAVEASTRERITWAEEIAFTTDYLALQQLRFGTRLNVRFNAAPGLERVSCPPLVLQPLVENAIRHGVERDTGPVSIDVVVELTGDDVHATVSNPVIENARPNPGLGAGLTSLRTRLGLAFGPRARVETKVEAGVHLARLTIPVDDD